MNIFQYIAYIRETIRDETKRREKLKEVEGWRALRHSERSVRKVEFTDRQGFYFMQYPVRKPRHGTMAPSIKTRRARCHS